MRGTNLLQLLDGRGDGWRKEVFIQISESQVGRAIRTGRWKYSVRAPDKDGVRDMGSDVYVEDCLYDLEEDPFEQTNLVCDPSKGDVRTGLARETRLRMALAGENPPDIRQLR
jgi:arylsulfatase A-like enzyme